MLRLLAFIFVFFSFNSYAVYYQVISDTNGELVGEYCTGSALSACFSLFPDSYNGFTGSGLSSRSVGGGVYSVSKK